MAQLSRPYQIGLLAVAVLAAAWLLLIHGHGERSGAPGSSPAQVSTTPAHPTTTHRSEGSAGQATGRGSSSSLGSLGHAVEKARGAVSTSEQNAKQLSESSTRASSETTTTSTSRPAETTAAPSKTKGSNATSTHAGTAAPAAPKASSPSAAAHNAATARQHVVEAQLAKGKIAVILFWDPRGSDDRLVHGALRSLRGNHSLNIAVDEASAGQVASFGTITRGVQVYGTPTMLFVNKRGRAVTLTGLQDGYAIAQAVREARHAG